MQSSKPCKAQNLALLQVVQKSFLENATASLSLVSVGIFDSLYYPGSTPSIKTNIIIYRILSCQKLPEYNNIYNFNCLTILSPFSAQPNCPAVSFTRTNMADEKSFRQLEDVGCPGEILAMKWSPKMDLIGVITEEGDMWLNRLSWQRVWTVRSSDPKAMSLAWRPDGKALALGLDNGKVKIINVENSECLHEYEVGSRPEFLEWVVTKRPESSNLPEKVRIFTEKDEDFLPRLPSLPSGGSTVFSQEKSGDAPWDPKRLKDLAETLSFLVIGDEAGWVTLLVHGMLPLCKVNVRSYCDEASYCRILSASLEANIRFLSVVVQTGSSAESSSDDGDVTMVTFDTTLYRSRSHELEVLALKYGRISSLLTYFEGTFQAMSDAWEDILLEIDTRLEKYAESLGPDTSVSEEFLALFTCGMVTPELQAFLVYDLTEKGLSCIWLACLRVLLSS